MKGIFLVMIIVFLTSFASASFQVGTPSNALDSSYGPGGFLKGWINLSFLNQQGDATFSDSFGNKINLINLLKLNSDAEYNCIPEGCESNYVGTNAGTTKTFILKSKNSILKGFVLNGQINSVETLNMSLTSNAPTSCFNQLEVDFFEDGTTDFGNDKATDSVCSFLQSYGCFDLNKPSDEFFIDSQPYCQRVTLSKSPGFRFGAWAKKESGNMNLSISLYSSSGEDIEKNCRLPDASTSGGEITCDINFLLTEPEEIYVCLNGIGDGVYKTRGYSNANGCGFHSIPKISEKAAFQIYAQGKRFNTPGQINISNKFADGTDINYQIQNYLQQKYGTDIECPSGGCVVPIKISSEQDQSITLANLLSQYTSIGPTADNKFYDAQKTAPLIISGFEEIFLDDANFSVPSDYGNQSLVLNFNGTDVVQKDIAIEVVPVINFLSPLTTASAVPTTFTVNIDNASTITNYIWAFGEGEILTTTKNSAEYTYNNSGTYEIKITTTDSEGRTSSGKFSVAVGSPKDFVNQTLEMDVKNLNNIKQKLNELPQFYREQIDGVIKTQELNSQIVQIQKDYASAASEDDYKEIVTELLKLKIPDSIIESKKAQGITYYPSAETIDISALQQIGGGSYDIGQENDYINAIINWESENIKVEINFTEFSAGYGEATSPIIRAFNVNINVINSLKFNPLIILRNLQDLKFQDEYLQSKSGDYVYTDLSSNSINLDFTTTEDVDFENLPFFISPDLSRISIETNNDNNTPTENINIWFWLALGALMIGAVIVYLFMSAWYKNDYENYLFRNKRNLYNLLSYVHNSKRNGMNETQIHERLKKAGWNSEQITYALNKHSGRRNELPFGNLFGGFFKNKNEPPRGINPGVNPFLNRRR